MFSLSVAFSFMPAAQFLASIYLPKNVPPKYKYLFLWHTYDFLTHFILEGSYLYHCFFSYVELPPASSDFPHPASLTPDGVYFLGQKSRRYGALYSNGPMARLWQEYAKADHRWGGADITLISLEILTVGLAGPCAMYIAYLISRITTMPMGREKTRLQARMWFFATMLATGELYGGENSHFQHLGATLTTIQASLPSAQNGFRETRSSQVMILSTCGSICSSSMSSGYSFQPGFCGKHGEKQ